MAVSTPNLLRASTAANTASPATGSASVNAGELLVVELANSIGGSNADLPSSVTWNGIALTAAVTHDGAGGAQAGWHAVGIYYLHVTVGATAAVQISSGQGTANWSWNVFTVTGHDTSAPFGDTDSVQADNGSGTTPSRTLTSAAGDLAIDVGASEGALTPGAGQTEMFDAYGGAWGNVYSYEAAAGASVTMSQAQDLDRGYVYAAAVIKSAGGGGGPTYDGFTRTPRGIAEGIGRGISFRTFVDMGRLLLPRPHRLIVPLRPRLAI